MHWDVASVSGHKDARVVGLSPKAAPLSHLQRPGDPEEQCGQVQGNTCQGPAAGGSQPEHTEEQLGVPARRKGGSRAGGRGLSAACRGAAVPRRQGRELTSSACGTSGGHQGSVQTGVGADLKVNWPDLLVRPDRISGP